MSEILIKIMPPADWAQAAAEGVAPLSTADAADGFVHLSTPAQVAGTLAAHYAQALEVALVPFPAAVLADGLRWEASRGGALFPHFYGRLEAAWALAPVHLTRPDAAIPFVVPALGG